jgi:hypothetical protein
MRQSVLLIAAIVVAEFFASLALAAPRTPAQSAAGSATCTDKTSQCWDPVSKQMRQCMIRTCTYGDGHTTSGGLVMDKGPTTKGPGVNPPFNAGTNKDPSGGTHPIVGINPPLSAGSNKGSSGGGAAVSVGKH